MRAMYNINMVTKAKRKDVLQKLRENLAQHIKIAQEARGGYFIQAQAALNRRLEEIAAAGPGKVTSLTFKLTPPVDHSSEYSTIIGMLEMHTEDTIELTSDEYRQLIENKWEWTDSFLLSNARYSETAAKLSG